MVVYFLLFIITSYEAWGKELVMLVLIVLFFYSHLELYLVVLFSTARRVESVELRCILYIAAIFYTINHEKIPKLTLPRTYTDTPSFSREDTHPDTAHPIMTGQ